MMSMKKYSVCIYSRLLFFCNNPLDARLYIDQSLQFSWYYPQQLKRFLPQDYDEYTNEKTKNLLSTLALADDFSFHVYRMASWRSSPW